MEAHTRLKRHPVFRVTADLTLWKVSRNTHFSGHYHSCGDAVRAACVSARSEDARGHHASVMLMPSGIRIAHNEPYFHS